MKRKRGHKKGKQKKTVAANVVQINTEDNSVFDDPDEEQLESELEGEYATASVVPNQQSAVPNTDTDGVTDRPAARSGIGRVKVKLKSSKLLEPQRTYSDALAQSESDRSSPCMRAEKQSEVVEKADDSGNSLAETQAVVSGKVAKKPGTLKIKSSKGTSSVRTINLTCSPTEMLSEKNTQDASDNDKAVDSSASRESQRKKPKLSLQNSRYKEQELNASLKVIKKVMKMDAAEPFNVPVDPDALGIPDYFEVIDTPMDFGTICNNLEHGSKYMNSEDVYKDVQYIWENCYKYNNKGDYVVDLMKRVKKNFMKYWTAAGLYIDQTKRSNGATLNKDAGNVFSSEAYLGKDITPETSGRKLDTKISKQKNIGISSLNGNESILEIVPQPGQEKLHVKSTPSKHKSRKRHGINHHKSNCLCAVCVVRRRRKEREGNTQVLENQNETSDGNLSQDFKLEDTVVNPFNEDALSNLQPSPDPGADADMEDQEEEMKLERPEQQSSPREKHEFSENEVEEGEPSEQLQNGSGEERNAQSGSLDMEDSGLVIHTDAQRDEALLQLQGGATARQLQRKQKESIERRQQIEMYKKLLNDVNPSLTKLCGSLFPDDPKSIWSGPHTLAPRSVPVRRDSAIHAAVSMFMK